MIEIEDLILTMFPFLSLSDCLNLAIAFFHEVIKAADLQKSGITVREASDVVEVKRNCKAKVSYRYICKRLERLGLVNPGQFDGVQFQKFEDKLYGVPFYRRRR